MRKSHYIQTINHKDIDFLNALRCGGICTKSQATQFISANRLKNFMLDSTLEKCSHTLPDGKRQEVYRITNEGKAWIREHIDSLADRKFYSSTGVQHDIQLMDKILSLSREERLTMRCEAEIRDEFKERLVWLQRIQDYSPPDYAEWCVQFAGNGHYFPEYDEAVDYIRKRKFLNNKQIQMLAR